ncbi:hypothetical protein Q427_24740 [Halomonas sp. BC04]|nr:hypothetical protein Q427_24740 [Halomonas sp. BC04]
MTRHYNFCAGPAALPTPVLERAREEMLDYQGRGLSVMEMSHRSPEFVAIAEQAEADLRELLTIPDNYRVLFMQGGASLQFSMVPMNLLGQGGSANFLYTGIWGKKALAEAKQLGFSVQLSGSSEDSGHTAVPRQADIELADDAATCTTPPTRPSAAWSSTISPVPGRAGYAVPTAARYRWSATFPRAFSRAPWTCRVSA